MNQKELFDLLVLYEKEHVNELSFLYNLLTRIFCRLLQKEIFTSKDVRWIITGEE